MSTVYTGGTFDLFHEGHLELLEACRRIAGEDGRVIVAVNTDEFVERYKGAAPVMSYQQRATLLEACRYVDEVVPNDREASTETIDEVGPVDIVAIGTDWACRDYYGQMGFTKEWLDERRIVLVYVDRRTGESTTSIKQRLGSEKS